MSRFKRVLSGVAVLAIAGAGVVSPQPLQAAISDFIWDAPGLIISGDTMTDGGSSSGYAVALGTHDDDYTVTATCILHENVAGGYWCGVQARQNDSAPDFVTTEAYMLLIGGSHGDKELALHRLGGGSSEVEMDSVVYDWNVGQEYKLILTVEGTTIVGCLEGGPCLSATNSVLSSGTAGVAMRRGLSSNQSPEIVDFTYDGEVNYGFDGTFADDDGNVHEGMIEAIAAQGITQGCSGDFVFYYCPFDLVLRSQMASFLARALGSPGTATDFFDDDDGTTHEDNINRIAQAEITLGCGPPRTYCPYDNVTRAQMALFLDRAFDLPASSTDWFSDDDGTLHEDSINALAAAGITLGCEDGLYCPSEFVQRDQMASFIGRVLGLTPIAP